MKAYFSFSVINNKPLINLGNVFFSSSKMSRLTVNTKHKNMPELFSINFISKDKYSPKLDFALFEFNSFFLKLICQRLFLSYLTNSKTKFSSLNFYKPKNDTIRFRKRKNIYFNISYLSRINNSRTKNHVFFINLLFFLLKLQKILLSIYKLNSKLLKISYSKRRLIVHFVNIGFLTSFINDQKFPSLNHLTQIEINFNSKLPESGFIRDYFILLIKNQLKIL